MLQQLRIANYAIIDAITIDFESQLNVITGETGAGKSILLGALSLILGDRADTKVLRDTQRKCVVEADFNIEKYGLQAFFEAKDLDFEAVTTVRREISTAGKSRAFINDTPVNLSTLKTFSNQLVNIHSQHETLALNSSKFQTFTLDVLADHADLVNEYKQAFKHYQKVQQALVDLEQKIRAEQAELDYKKFQLDELEQIQLDAAGFENALTQQSLLEHSEQIQQQLNTAYLALDRTDGESVLAQLLQASSALSDLRKIYPKSAELIERIESCHTELEDLAQELEQQAEQCESDPAQLASIVEQTDLIHRLMMKHQLEDFNELLTFRNTLSEELLTLENAEEAIETAKQAVTSALATVKKLGLQISKNRAKSGATLSKAVVADLAELGMPHSQLQVKLNTNETPKNNGFDQVQFLFASNKGMPVKPINEVASGGELSRLMLCIQSLLAGKAALPTLIFDEIDTGVSGDVASKIGALLKKLSAQHQLITITHLAQVASKGQHHLYIYKETDAHQTYTKVRALQADEKVKAIAQMLSGAEITEAALANAKMLMG